jgi:hypothetical protein
MVMQFSDATVHGALDGIETAAGTAPTVEIRSGAKPATCATADSGTLLASFALPSDWLAAASARAKAKAGTWTGTGGAGAGAGTNAGHFRIKQGATCHIQGSITITAGGGDMTLDNISIANGQAFTVDSFTLSGPAA